MVKKNCAILNVDAGVDYVFWNKLNYLNHHWAMKRDIWALYCFNAYASKFSRTINNRVVETLGHTEDVLWFLNFV